MAPVAMPSESMPEAPAKNLCPLEIVDFDSNEKMRLPEPKRKKKDNDEVGEISVHVRGFRLRGGGRVGMFFESDPLDTEGGVEFSKGKDVLLEVFMGMDMSPPSIQGMVQADIDGDGAQEIVLHYLTDSIDPAVGLYYEENLAVIAMPSRKLALEYNGDECKSWTLRAGTCDGKSTLVITCDSEELVYTRDKGAIKYEAAKTTPEKK